MRSLTPFDAKQEAAKIEGMSDAELKQLERSNRPRATPNMAARHDMVDAELKRRDLFKLQNFHK